MLNVNGFKLLWHLSQNIKCLVIYKFYFSSHFGNVKEEFLMIFRKYLSFVNNITYLFISLLNIMLKVVHLLNVLFIYVRFHNADEFLDNLVFEIPIQFFLNIQTKTFSFFASLILKSFPFTKSIFCSFQVVNLIESAHANISLSPLPSCKEQ